MKFWYDTEFIDDGKTIDLVSIGIVAEDGREFYAVSGEFDVRKLAAKPWLVEHVWPSLPTFKHPKSTRCACGIGHLDLEHPAVRSRGQIARAVQDFVLVDEHPELWSWYPSYDHVVLAQLYGPMSELPTGMPMRTNDIEQEAERLQISGLLPDPPPGHHNALVDARYHQQLYAFVQDREADQRNELRDLYQTGGG